MNHAVFVTGAQAVNVSVTFLVSLAWALLCARIAPTDNLKKWCLCLPFVKVTWLVAAGVPAGAYVASAFAGQRWDLGSFQLGLALRPPMAVPRVVAELGAQRADAWYGLSVGDGVTHFLVTRGLSWALLLVVVVLTLVAALKLGFRLSVWCRHARQDRRQQAWARRLGETSVFGRRVFLLERVDAQPSAVAGVFRPCVWVSKALVAAPAEVRAAAIEHELCHLRHADVPTFALLGVVADALWFLPGRAYLLRRIHARAELAADTGALRRGADPLALAQAILCEAEGRRLALALNGSVVLERVARLTSRTPLPRRRARLALLVASYLSAGLMLSHFFGYH